MKKKFGAILISIGMAASMNVLAGSTPKWYENVQIRHVFAGPASQRAGVHVTTSVDVEFGTCASAQYYADKRTVEFTLDRNNPYYKDIYSMIMIAYTTGKPISMYVNGDCADWGVMVSDVRLN